MTRSQVLFLKGNNQRAVLILGTFNPGPALACKAGVKRAYLGNTLRSAGYLSNVAPGQALVHFRHLQWMACLS